MPRRINENSHNTGSPVFPRVPAHTNAPGVHIMSEYRSERSEGTWYNVDTGLQDYHNYLDAEYAIPVAMSRKADTYHGDHETAYDYNRGVSRVMEDTPYRIHSYYDNPVDHKTSNYDFVSNKFISKEHGPFVYSFADGPTIENAWDRSVTTALNNLAGMHSASLGASLGELQQTVEMLAHRATQGFWFIRDMRRGRWKDAAYRLGLGPRRFQDQRGKNLADYWLEYAYGWRPLAQDMFDLHDTIAEGVNRLTNEIEATGTVHVGGDREWLYEGRLNVVESWRARLRTVIKASIDNPMLHLLNELGLTNPASVAWELVPFSFVVDWFVPVGNTLEAMSAGMGLSFHGGYMQKNVYTRLNLSRKTGQITPWTTITNGGLYREHSSEFQRIALTGFPYARFYANQSPFSTPRTVNALALIRTLHTNV